MGSHTSRTMSHGMNNEMARGELWHGSWGVVYPVGRRIDIPVDNYSHRGIL